MKNLNLFTAFLLMTIMFSANLLAQENINMFQQICPSQTSQSSQSGEKAMWDIYDYFETTSSSQGGVATDGEFIYTSSFSTELFRKFEMDGTFVEEFTISGIDKIGCLTYDGTYFYGAEGFMESGIEILDLENHTLIGNISVNAPSMIAIGHLSWDPTLDGGAGGYWIGYWAELGAVDKQGNEIIPNVATSNPGIAGTAIDTVTDPNNPSVICFKQTGSSNLELAKYDINNQSFSDVLHVATDIPGPSGGSDNSVASGMNSYINKDGKLILLGLIDCFPGNEMVFQYELSNAETYTNDISVKKLIDPVTGESLSENEVIKVELVNNGSETQSNFDIQYTINDGTGTLGPFVETVTNTMNPGANIYFSFDETADMSLPGVSYTIEITALLSNDENSANDLLTKVITNTSGNYCDASGGSSASAEYIANVNIAGISNSSSADHYADYTGDPNLYIYLDPNSGTNLTITLANGYNADIGAAWIDWNDNGDFYDGGDHIFTSQWGPGPYQTTINVPDDALQGTPIRMRLRVDYNTTDPDPCGSTSFGEVEDYTVIVSAVQLNPPLNLQYELVEDNVNLSWDAPSSKGLLNYKVYYSKNMGPFNLLADVDLGITEYSTENPGEGIHRYYVTANYDDGESVPSNTVEFILTGLNHEQDSNIELYPNPVSDIIYIQAPNKIKNIKLYNYLGEIVMDHDLNIDKYQINSKEFESGFYIIKIKTQTTTLYSRVVFL